MKAAGRFTPPCRYRALHEKNLLYGKLKGGFPGLAAVLLLSCSLMFVSCGEDDDESGGGGGGIGTEIASDFQGTGFGGESITVPDVATPYSGTDFEVTSTAVKKGTTDIITGLKTGNGGNVTMKGNTIGKWAYIYKGDTKIGLAAILRMADYGGSNLEYFFLGKTESDGLAEGSEDYGVTIDTSGMNDDYAGSLTRMLSD